MDNSDERLLWLEARVSSSLKRGHSEVFKRMLQKDESRQCIAEFLETPDAHKLFLYFAERETLVASHHPPARIQAGRKLIYFMKPLPSEISMKNISSSLIFGDIVAPLRGLDHMLQVAQEIYLPLIDKQDSLPSTVRKEALSLLHNFLGNAYVLAGQVQGKSLLSTSSLPDSFSSSSSSNSNAESDPISNAMALETCVVQWIQQMKTALAFSEPPPTATLLLELDFWLDRADNLNTLWAQLDDPRIEQVINALETAKSTFTSTLSSLRDEVKVARDLANSNANHLRPLRKWLLDMNARAAGTDFRDVAETFPPLVHIIYLIWKTSSYYNNNARLVVLLQDLCNNVIDLVRSRISSKNILSQDPTDVVSNLETTIAVCTKLREIITEYKKKASWDFETGTALYRLEMMVARCHDVRELVQTFVQFEPLGRVEIGPVGLSTSISHIHVDFVRTIQAFQDDALLGYDLFDIDASQFDRDFYQFRTTVKELEARLAAVLNQAFEACTTVDAVLKLMESFGPLLEREIIRVQLEQLETVLLKYLNDDFVMVKTEFDQLAKKGPIKEQSKETFSTHMPLVAGTVVWSRGLIERIKGPMDKLLALNRTLHVLNLDRPEDKASQTVEFYHQLVRTIGEYASSKIEEWISQVDTTSQATLKQALLRRDKKSVATATTTPPSDSDVSIPNYKPRDFLVVNFDAALAALLGEARSLLSLGVRVPEAALVLLRKSEALRTQRGNLEIIVHKYNSVLAEMADIERGLLQPHLESADSALEKGIVHLSWKSHGIAEFITQAMTNVKDLSTMLSTVHTNAREIDRFVTKWSSLLLIVRKEKRTYTADDIREKHNQLMTSRKAEINEGAIEIHKLLKSSGEALRIGRASLPWKAYLDHMASQMVASMRASVFNSLSYLAKQMGVASDPKQDAAVTPLLEIRLELVPPNIHFVPDFVFIKDMIDGWMDEFLKVFSVVRRLDGSDADYVNEILSDNTISALMKSVQKAVTDCSEQCNTYKDTYNKYSYLWTTDISTSFKEFLKSQTQGQGQGQEPSLAQFDETITKYRQVLDEISSLPPSATIGWVRVDAKPVKGALSAWTNKWIGQYTAHLKGTVLQRLEELSSFIQRVNRGLDLPMPDDLPALIDFMTYIMEVRERVDFDDMFVPLRRIVGLLKKHSVSVGDDSLRFLDEAPGKWALLKKKTAQVKEKLASQQSQQMEKITQDQDVFYRKTQQFRSQFLSQAPLKYTTGVDVAYQKINELHVQLCTIEKEAAALNRLQKLFELPVVEYIHLRDCRQELVWLKQMWDLVGFVDSVFAEWKRVPWQYANTEFLEDETKRFLILTKSLNKAVREWDVYVGLENSIKVMKVSLPLVQDLKSKAMRDRHWKQLIKLTGATPGTIAVSDERFKLDDLISLGIHKYGEDVVGIVEKANKELQIDAALTKIDQTWTFMRLEFALHTESDVYLLKNYDEVFESLEEYEVQLHSMLSSKHVATFEDEVAKWSKRLTTTEGVLTTWLEVQRAWASLQGIFCGTNDIREQLPEDSERFIKIDRAWREIIANARTNPNVLQACAVTGLHSKLQEMLTLLEKCEKSLAQYLELKRRAFPRFYFVSAGDLLDILSKGRDPQAITRYISKIFESIATPEYSGSSVVAVTSKEGEYLKLSSPISTGGAVESWLGDLLKGLQETIRDELERALATRASTPFDIWIQNCPAQIAILASQITWTQEAIAAFERLQEGVPTAMKDFYKKQHEKVDRLTVMVQGELPQGERLKIISLITIEVHARDIVAKLVEDKADSLEGFSWLSQLRYYWDTSKRECYARLVDSEFVYGWEYQGNSGRLVITPLTDRAYITLTQALKLCMGAAPSGPAGTGKTETSKDLGKSLGLAVYVFNCSEQMDYKTMAEIFKGLAMSGVWACFDEFNRIAREVLSVVSTQFGSILDAIKMRKKEFIFEGEEISLVPTCGCFITMNPGYKGRSELPENLKALFRPMSMVNPDIALICEILLFSEGFKSAKVLSKKVVALYKLSKELLSKQDHYDWGLRALKSLLVNAGSLKRAEPEIPEEHILMRALRDFNKPKIVADDSEVFLGLVSDLFPDVQLPRKVDKPFEETIKTSAVQLGLQPEDNFILKVVQFHELLGIRHSVFILGPAGSGKSCTWKTLVKAYSNMGNKTMVHILNPKSVSTAELFGSIHPVTRDWKDGLFSNTMRDLAYNPSPDRKWILMDGDIDPIWIESLNSVMDDSKTLTLPNAERILLNPTMRLVFEAENLKHATPATVSRAGIIFINADDIGWWPLVTSWIAKWEQHSMQQVLHGLFTKYVGGILDLFVRGDVSAGGGGGGGVKTNPFTPMVAIPAVNMVSTLCALLEGLLGSKNCPPEGPKEIVEPYFIFACIWAFGGPLSGDKVGMYDASGREAFNIWWRRTWTHANIPEDGLVFDYFVDPETKKFIPWEIPPYSLLSNGPEGNTTTGPTKALVTGGVRAMVVPTLDTVRLSYLVDLLTSLQRPVLLVGNAGCGKSVILEDKLRALAEAGSDTLSSSIHLNHSSDSGSVEKHLELHLEKKAGRVFGPPGNKKLLVVLDSANMPLMDEFGTQSALAFLRQHLDYSSFYDREKMTLKEVKDVQYVASMNPFVGPRNVDTRFLRHFATFACPFPTKANLQTIYSTILQAFFPVDPTFAGESSNKANASPAQKLIKLCKKFVNATISLHQAVSESFLPTASKFHYVFNLRDLSNVFQGLCMANADFLTRSNGVDGIRLWIHECCRVYGDKMVSESDVVHFHELLIDVSKKNFEDFEQTVLHAKPLLYLPFSAGEGEAKAMRSFTEYSVMKTVLKEKMDEYNEYYPRMDLELFEQAIDHVCRISRILSFPRGHAMLLGVGGSGKQSLARLAGFMAGLEIATLTTAENYGPTEFLADIAALYVKVGVKSKQIALIINDSQVPDERFLVILNDILATGYTTGLFAEDEKTNAINNIRYEVKQTGQIDDNDTCWKYFLSKVQLNLHLVLCFSPNGDVFRNYCRHYPAVVSSAQIDYFHEWTIDALVSVARRFLLEASIEPESGESTPIASNEVLDNIAQHMAYAHRTVQEQSVKFLEVERRYNYATPKSYLEFINMYKRLIIIKATELDQQIARLQTGIDMLHSTTTSAAQLKETLEKEQIVVEEKKAATETLLDQLSVARAKAEEQGELAKKEEDRAKQIAEETQEYQQAAKKDLEEAEPAIAAAVAALNTLDKTNLTELKSFAKPPKDVVEVCAAVSILINGEASDWSGAKKMMQRVDPFLSSLINFDKDKIPLPIVEQLQPYIDKPDFTGQAVRTKSSAAAGLCEWVRNVVAYNKVFRRVQPKREKLGEATAKLEAVNISLQALRDKVALLDAENQKLTETFEQAMQDKNNQVKQAERTAEQLMLAERLVGALQRENVRWAESMKTLRDQKATLPGDMVLTAAFIAYSGAFNQAFRKELTNKFWLPDIRERAIPVSESIDPLAVLADDARIAEWKNQGLPADKQSEENGAIITWAHRWPLIIDPQVQGKAWISQLEKGRLKILRTDTPGWLEALERSMSAGESVLIEGIKETIDPLLEPILARGGGKRGRSVRVGDRVVEYDEKFKLYLHTKLANPHYKPEIVAQITIVDFSVTEVGLEEQILAVVVDKEHPELEKQRSDLIRVQNESTIHLKQLEDRLLTRLASSSQAQTGQLSIQLSDIELIENLQATKASIESKVVQFIATEKEINRKRNSYRPVAAVSAMLYFIIDKLKMLDHMYQYSFLTFMGLVTSTIAATEGGHHDDPLASVPSSSPAAAIGDGKLAVAESGGDETPAEEGKGARPLSGRPGSGRRPGTSGSPSRPLTADSSTPKQSPNGSHNRVHQLVENITFNAFQHVSRGLFEKHRLVFATQLCLGLQLLEKTIEPVQVEFLLRGGQSMDNSSSQLTASASSANPAATSAGLPDWMDSSTWAKVNSLTELEGFGQLASDISAASKRWKEWYCAEKPEQEKLPQDYKNLPNFQKLLIIKVLRPDRVTLATYQYIVSSLGARFMEPTPTPMLDAVQEASQSTPLLFILSPGVDPFKDVEDLARRNGFTLDNGSFLNVALGDGQEEFATRALKEAHSKGGWVMLQNIHLTRKWLLLLEKMLEELSNKPSSGPFRVFLSAEPNKDIPVGVLQRSIKLTSEPPQGLRANAKRACGFFGDDVWENANYGIEYKTLLFSLCLYHSLVVERIKFGPAGWNNTYPFNKGDLVVCGKLLSTRVGEGGVVPWEELRFLVGEIMYGGHITDSWDRRLNGAYVNQFLREEIIRNPGDADFMPGLRVPDRIPFDNLSNWLDHSLPAESPVAFGLQPSADIGVRSDLTDVLLKTLVEMQGTTSGSSGSAVGMTREEKVKVVLDDILEKLPENFDIQGVLERLEEKGPFGNVFLQECYYMNTLLSTIRSSLRLLDLALKGDITFTDALESTMMSLFNEQVPAAWSKVAYPSVRRLGLWFSDLLRRVIQLDTWVRNLIPPKVVWISGLFNPQAFLTAIMQTTARKNSWALDNMVLITEVTKKTVEEMEKETLKEGAYISGLYLDGARWDTQKEVLDNPQSGSGVVLKDLYPAMPVTYVRASNTMPTDPNLYHCPVYMTPQRGSTFVFTATLKTKLPPATWITAGTALLMDKPE